MPGSIFISHGCAAVAVTDASALFQIGPAFCVRCSRADDDRASQTGIFSQFQQGIPGSCLKRHPHEQDNCQPTHYRFHHPLPALRPLQPIMNGKRRFSMKKPILFATWGSRKNKFANSGVQAPGWQGTKTKEISSIIRVFVTPPGRIHGRVKCEVNFAQALRRQSLAGCIESVVVTIIAASAMPGPGCRDGAVQFRSAYIERVVTFIIVNAVGIAADPAVIDAEGLRGGGEGLN